MTRRTLRGTPAVGYWLVTKITDRNGNTATFNYPPIGAPGAVEIQSISTSDLRTVTFTYASGRLASIAADGRTWLYNVQSINSGSWNELSAMTPPVGSPWQYTYYADNLANVIYGLKTVSYPQGGLITYDYAKVFFIQGVLGSPQSTVVKSKATSDGTWMFAYTPSSSPGSYDTTTVTLPGGLGTITYKHFGYATNSNVWQIGLLKEKSTGTVQTETFNWDGFLVISSENDSRPGYNYFDTVTKKPLLSSRVVSRDGATYTTTYSSFDGLGNPQAISESGNKSRSSTLSYFPVSASTWIIGLKKDESLSGIGSITRSFDANGNLNSITRYGVTTSYAYLSDGSISSKTDPRSSQTSYSSYFRGIPQSESRPEGVTIARVADYFGNITSQTDGISTWGYGYDNLNRMTSVNFPTGSSAAINWNSTSTSRTFTRGALVETRNFDSYARPTNMVRAGASTIYGLDALGRKTFESYPNGNPNGVSQTLDLLGRVKTSTSPAGQKTTTYYGSSLAVQNERGISTAYSYDRYGDPDGGYLVGVDISGVMTTTMVKNAIGLAISVTQGAILRTYGYLGNYYLSTITEPESGTTTFGRDNNGNMTSKSVGGVTTSYEYDGLDRLKKTTHSDSAGTVNYGYNNRSQLLSVTNPFGTRQYEYDANGNLQRDKLTVDTNVFDTTFTYDALDGLASVKYPLNDRVVTYTPDSLGRPTTVSPYLSQVAHFPSGNLSAINYPNSVFMTFYENTWQLPTTISSGPVSMTYSYDGVGNVQTISNSIGADSKTMCYDNADRLIGTNGCSGMFTYDARDNITKNDATTYAYDPNNNRLLSTGGSSPRTFMTDSRGNITSYGGNTFTFDNASQLKCVNCGLSNEIKYAYDGKGQRIWQEKDGARTYFVQASNGDLLLEYMPKGKVWKEHAYLHGKRIATREGTNAVATTLSMSANPSSPAVATNLTLSASITNGATGSVKFYDNGQLVGVGTVAGTSASATLLLATAGTHNFTATYAGDDNYQPANANLALNVLKASQTIATTTTPPGSWTASDNTIDVSNSASASSHLPVTFSSTTTNICTASGSNGSLITLTHAAGTCVVSVAQSGDANYFAASSATLSFQITTATPGIAVTSSMPSAVVGDSIFFTANLSNSALPIGTISLLANDVTIRTLYVAPGTPQQAYTMVVNELPPGTHSIKATYSGDANNLPSTSAPITQIIAKRASSTTCSVSSTSLFNVQQLTVMVMVNGSSPTGAVTISENGNPIATGALAGGATTAAFRIPMRGIHTITASYGGDGVHLPSTCAGIPVDVKIDPSMVMIIYMVLFSDD